MAAVKKNENITEEVQHKEQKFSKEQIAASKRYESQKDLINALLTDGKTYALEDVDEKIEKYLKGRVK